MNIISESEECDNLIQKDNENELDENKGMDLNEKVNALWRLKFYMLPLLILYFSEYTTNLGLAELLYYPLG